MIDTHCHLTFPDFADRIDETLAHAASLGVDGCITISTTVPDALAALTVAEQHERVWCSAGVHPLYADQGPHDWGQLRRLAGAPKCVAWGELGLDNHYREPARTVQDRVLEEQLAAIEEAHRAWGRALPVILHCREAFEELIPRLRASTLDPARFVFHCFTGNQAEARLCLDFGAMISFTGVVTYQNAPEVREAARVVPADRIMVETDAPFLSPVPMRGKRPCMPGYARHTAEALAGLRGQPWDEFHAAINANSARFFGVS
ncbi:MAG: TatD family hydrolase [Phycisphaerales bacterium]|nr:TatD family hydrolase [Phycisphaerales bacterium]